MDKNVSLVPMSFPAAVCSKQLVADFLDIVMGNWW